MAAPGTPPERSNLHGPEPNRFATLLLLNLLAAALASLPELIRVFSGNVAPGPSLHAAWFTLGTMLLLAFGLTALLRLLLWPVSSRPMCWLCETIGRLRTHLRTPARSRDLLRSLLAQALLLLAALAALATMAGILTVLFSTRLPLRLAVLTGMAGLVVAGALGGYILLLRRRLATATLPTGSWGDRLVHACGAHLHEYLLILALALGGPLAVWGLLGSLGLSFLFDGFLLLVAVLLLALPLGCLKLRPRLWALLPLTLVLLAGVPFGLDSLEARSALGGHKSLVGFLETLAQWNLDLGFSEGAGAGVAVVMCDPKDPSRGPLLRELPDNGLDDNCNGLVDGQLHDLCRDPAYLAALEEARAAYRKPSGPTMPDILLLSWDATRADHLSLYGYQRMTTPLLDDLAQRAAVFTAAQAPSARTNQSMPALLSGRMPFSAPGHTMPQRFVLADEAVTFPERLKQAGYVTGAVGSGWDFDPITNWNQGFDFWVQPRAFTSNEVAGPTQVTASLETIARMRTEGDKPMFFWVHLVDPHGKYLVHEGTPWPIEGEADAYDSELWFTDRNTRQIVDEFRRSGRPKIIVMLSDHGEALGEHGNNAHGDLHREITWVPFFILVEGLPGWRLDAPVSTLDLFPTLLDLLGLEPEDGVHGCSLLGALLRGNLTARGPVFSQFVVQSTPKISWLAVTDGTIRMQRELVSNTTLLYDLATDPKEELNLFGQAHLAKFRLYSLLNEAADTFGTWPRDDRP